MMTIDFNCEHDLVTLIGETDKETTDDIFEGRTHYYLNCMICKTTLLRDENYFKDYKYSGIDIKKQPMYRKTDYLNEK